MKNSKKNVATNKKAYQAALIKKATAKKTNSTPAVDTGAEGKWQSSSGCIGIPFVELSGN